MSEQLVIGHVQIALINKNEATQLVSAILNNRADDAFKYLQQNKFWRNFGIKTAISEKRREHA